MDHELPPYSYVPGGPWPHPNRSDPAGPRGDTAHPPAPIDPEDWASSTPYLHGLRLFDAGYYWEAHEVWESLWHAHGRRGVEADLLKALIKMAAAGVKVREGHPRGVATHAGRARDLFLSVRERTGPTFLGVDLERLARIAGGIAERPAARPGSSARPVERVFDFSILHP